MWTERKRCRSCMNMRDCYPIGRRGGGTYKRGGRQYWSSICGPCATRLAGYLGDHAGAVAERFDGRALRAIAAHEAEKAQT